MARVLVLCLFGAIALCGPSLALATPAGPPTAPDRVPVVILDGGLGDARFYVTHWFGEAQEVASSGSLHLLTTSAPTWWAGAGSPDTYVLTTSEDSGTIAAGPIGVPEIGWALDRVAERHPEGKAILVAQGATGLSARAYLEDLGTLKQSARADVVGLVMLGTPNVGLTLPGTYPGLDVWPPFAAGAGLTPADLVPGSPLLASLDGGRLPAVVRTLVIQGVAVSFGDRETDGIALRGDSVIATGVAVGAIDYVTVKARASESWAFDKTWLSASKRGGATLNVVADQEVDRLALARGYSTAPDVRDALKKYYEAWFANGAPVTHISTRLVFDVSGSMSAKWGSTTKLDGGRAAVSDFASAMSARQALPSSVPEDVGLVLFNQGATVALSGTSNPSALRRALASVKAQGNTDVGKALSAAVKSFADAPRASDKFMILLSDGLNTVGLDEQSILKGPVASAKKRGIRIDTIALGTVGTSDVGFLTTIASSTGGTFHQARDTFELRRDFIRARYSSVGTIGVDVAVDLSKVGSVALPTITASARLLEIAVVPDGAAASWQVMRNGSAVDTASINSVTSPDGVSLLALQSPKPGTYTLKLVDAHGSRRAQVFATVQADAFRQTGSSAPPDSSATLLLIISGVAAVLALGVVAFTSVRGRTRTTSSDDSAAPVGEDALLPLDDEGGE